MPPRSAVPSPRPSPLRSPLATALRSAAVLLAAAAAACGDASGGAAKGASAPKPKVAFVTNSVSDFWAIGEHGARAAEKDFGLEVTVRMPPNGVPEEQKRILEDLLSRGVEGIAVSPLDPANMTALLDRIAARALLVTHDSDAPASERLAYVGMDNYAAGRLAGELVKQALPDGGAIVLVIGNLDQDNGRRRRQGVIDEVLGRGRDPSRFDPPDVSQRAGKWEIRATLTDQYDRGGCKSLVQDALTRHADLACVVGLFAYEPPVILDAVRSAGRAGKVAIVGFDEQDETLQGVADGTIAGTVVQNPYEYGYRSLELLAKLLREKDPAKRAALLPPGGFVDIPARKIERANVAAFRADLEAKTRAK